MENEIRVSEPCCKCSEKQTLISFSISFDLGKHCWGTYLGSPLLLHLDAITQERLLHLRKLVDCHALVLVLNE